MGLGDTGSDRGVPTIRYCLPPKGMWGGVTAVVEAWLV